MDYEKMLKKARKELPDSVLKTERFAIPKVRGHIQGNKTVISNLYQICDLFGRDFDHFLKYLLRELATPAEANKPQVILKRKTSAKKINEKIEEYGKKYVICKECGKPDTTLTKQNRILQMRCKACGARYPVS
jgi:translation initiation factor 2 subunit 2